MEPGIVYDLWVKLRISEKEFSRHNGHYHVRERPRNTYKYHRSIFDRKLRKAERKYNQNMLEKLEKISTDNPNGILGSNESCQTVYIDLIICYIRY